MIIEKTVGSEFGPLSFERPLSQSYMYSRRWNRELPESVRLSLDVLPTINRTLDPQEIEQASRAMFLRNVCAHSDSKVFVGIPNQVRKKQGKGIVVYVDTACFEAPREPSLRRLRKPTIRMVAPAFTASDVLRDLEAMLNEQDEPDFVNRPTEYSHGFAKQIIGNLYTHYLGSAPIPALAADGEGGIVAEWKSGHRIVRLIVSANQAGKSYVYSRGHDQSTIDHSASGLILVQRLRSIFSSE